MRDVNNGWLIRYLHSNTASAFFFIVYLHIGRGMYYGSYRAPRTLVWTIGTVIFILMMATKRTTWPNWLVDNQVNYTKSDITSVLPFNKNRTRATLRVGPHNIDVLSIIICGMLKPTTYYNKIHRNNYSTLKSEPVFNADNKKKRLKNFERKSIFIPNDLQEILIGLLLGDVCAQKRSTKGNTNLHFEQGLVHKDYLFHLFELFKSFSGSPPKIAERKPDKRTGKVYTRVQFATLTLPCFNVLYENFYPKGKKVVPSNIEELLTPLGLAYWLCDDGTFCKKHKYIRIATNSYTLQEVDLLLGVLRSKYNLTCYSIQERSGYVITIAAKSVISLRPTLEPLMPAMMLHKIGLQSLKK